MLEKTKINWKEADDGQFFKKTLHRHILILIAIHWNVFVGTATQLVNLPPHIPRIGQVGGIWLLRYSVICVIGLANSHECSPTYLGNACPKCFWISKKNATPILEFMRRAFAIVAACAVVVIVVALAVVVFVVDLVAVIVVAVKTLLWRYFEENSKTCFSSSLQLVLILSLSLARTLKILKFRAIFQIGRAPIWISRLFFILFNHDRQPSLWPDLAIYCTLGNFSKSVTPIILPKLPTHILGNFCKGVKIFQLSCEIIFG